jgi:hypothetical protein
MLVQLTMVSQPNELIINLKTAKALGSRAQRPPYCEQDEVIESES